MKKFYCNLISKTESSIQLNHSEVLNKNSKSDVISVFGYFSMLKDVFNDKVEAKKVKRNQWRDVWHLHPKDECFRIWDY